MGLLRAAGLGPPGLDYASALKLLHPGGAGETLHQRLHNKMQLNVAAYFPRMIVLPLLLLLPKIQFARFKASVLRVEGGGLRVEG